MGSGFLYSGSESYSIMKLCRVQYYGVELRAEV